MSGRHAERVSGTWPISVRVHSSPTRSVLGRETAIQKVEWTEDGWLRLTTGGTLARLMTPGLAGKGLSGSPDRP